MIGHKRAARPAFTLIELLVVIAINDNTTLSADVATGKTQHDFNLAK
jgi:Tfp pilus assembly protein PilE